MIRMQKPGGGYISVGEKFVDKYIGMGYTMTGGSSSGGGSQPGRLYPSNYGVNSDPYEQEKRALIAQLRSSISKAKGSYRDIIKKAPQTYQPLRNQTEVSKEQMLSSMREALANGGDRGGTGRQELLGINTAAGNQMNEIDLQQQNTINDAKSAISDLDEQAAFKESEINASIAAQKLRDIIAAQKEADSMTEDTRRWNADYELKLKDREAEAAEQALSREIETIGRYYTDFQAEIKRREGTPDKADDALIPYLQAARAEKQAKQLADADNSANQAYKNAYQLWLQLGIATPEIAKILGIPEGSKTLDKVKAEYTTGKPYYKPDGGSPGGIPGIPSEFTD